VAVKLAHHHDTISAAIAAGKMVLSEWPLGSNLSQAQDLYDRAAAAGVRTAAGLQARFSPAIGHARKLIEDGYIGKVLASTIVGSGIGWGPETDKAQAYMYDASVHLKDEGKSVPVTAPDQVAIFGGLESGATVSVFYRGGTSRGSNLHWEINGTEGDLVLSSPIGNIQVADLRLSGGRQDNTGVAEIAIPDASLPQSIAELPGGNVFRLYAQLAEDVRTGGHITPNFAHALQQHHLVAAIEKASNSGLVQAIER
jgi:predicted dehydrogenase